MDAQTNTTPPGEGKPASMPDAKANLTFASYVTGAAFRIDLSKRMVGALLSAAKGCSIDSSHYGVHSLTVRGLMVPIDEQERRIYKKMRLTDAGQKVAELCLMAGLGGDA